MTFEVIVHKKVDVPRVIHLENMGTFFPTQWEGDLDEERRIYVRLDLENLSVYIYNKNAPLHKRSDSLVLDINFSSKELEDKEDSEFVFPILKRFILGGEE